MLTKSIRLPGDSKLSRFDNDHTRWIVTAIIISFILITGLTIGYILGAGSVQSELIVQKIPEKTIIEDETIEDTNLVIE